MESRIMPPIKEGFTLLAFTCARAPFEVVAGHLESSLPDRVGGSWAFEHAPLNLRALGFPEPRPGGAHFPEIQVWEPSCHPDRCVWITNLQDGWQRLANSYFKELAVEFTTIRTTAVGVEWPVFAFEHFALGTERRIVQLLKGDPKWVFFQRGDFLPFEEAAAYLKRRVRDRLTGDHILAYLAALGYEAGDPAFWRSTGNAFHARQLAWRTDSPHLPTIL